MMLSLHLMFFYEISLPIQFNLKLKIWPKQILGSLLLAFALPSFKANGPSLFNVFPDEEGEGSTSQDRQTLHS